MRMNTVVVISAAALASWLAVLAIAYALFKAPGWTALGLGAVTLSLLLIGLERRLKSVSYQSGEHLAATGYK